MKIYCISHLISVFYICPKIPLEPRLLAKNAALVGVPTKRGSRSNQAWFKSKPRQYFFEPNLVQGGLMPHKYICMYFNIKNIQKYF